MPEKDIGTLAEDFLQRYEAVKAEAERLLLEFIQMGQRQGLCPKGKITVTWEPLDSLMEGM